MSKVSLKAVVVGAITDIVSTNIAMIPILIYFVATRIDFARLPHDQVQPAISAALQSQGPLFVIGLVVGALCSVLGGYVGARLATHDEMLNGSLTSFLCVAIGLYSLSRGNASGSLPLQLLGFISSPALGLLGGYLRVLQKRTAATTLQPI